MRFIINGLVGRLGWRLCYRAWRRRCDLMRQDRTGMRSDSLLDCSVSSPHLLGLVGKCVCAGPHVSRLIPVWSGLVWYGMVWYGEWGMIIPPSPSPSLSQDPSTYQQMQDSPQNRNRFFILLLLLLLLSERSPRPAPLTPLVLMRCGATGRIIS